MKKPDRSPPPQEIEPTDLPDEVAAKEVRKVASRREHFRGVWFGLGMMGMVGWAVAIPLVAGMALGYLMDSGAASPRISWTLTGLLLGATLGCFHAWYWITRQNRDAEATAGEGEQNVTHR